MNSYSALEEWYETGAGPNPLMQVDHLQSAASRTFLFLVAAAWGLITVFSMKLGGEAETGGGTIVQGIGLTTAFVLFLLVDTSPLMVWVTTGAGALVTAHALFAMLSGAAHQANLYQSVRYALLIPAFSVMIAAARLGPAATGRMRAGLTLGAFAGAMYHLALVNPSMLLNSNYRLGRDAGFANPNSLGLIAMVAAVSLLDFGLVSLRTKRKKSGMLWLACAGLCVLTAFLTRSRTAALAGLVGMAVCVLLTLGRTRTLVVVVLLGVLVVPLFGGQLGSEISDVYDLDGGAYGRDISTATGRTRIWGRIIRDVWLPNFAFGAGPQPLFSHNGWLENLGQVGIFGTLPLVVLVAWGLIRAWRYRRCAAAWFAISISATTLVEAMAEAQLFSIGNPSSLLFVLSIAVLTAAPLEEWTRGEAEAAAALPYGQAAAAYGAGYDPAY